jgi:N-acetylglucosamine-6-phosphate deacetylase
MGLGDTGVIAVGSTADLVVLDRQLRVQSTYVAGQVWAGNPAARRDV